jgi:hypothetical protein
MLFLLQSVEVDADLGFFLGVPAVAEQHLLRLLLVLLDQLAEILSDFELRFLNAGDGRLLPVEGFGGEF